MSKLIAGKGKDCKLHWELGTIVRKDKKLLVKNSQLQKKKKRTIISHLLTELIHLCEVPGREDIMTVNKGKLDYW